MTPKHVTRRPLLAGTIATLAIVVTAAWLAYSYRQSDAAASAPAALPQVVVSKPLEREVDSRLGFLGQFSAVEQVELRAQVGGNSITSSARGEQRRWHVKAQRPFTMRCPGGRAPRSEKWYRGAGWRSSTTDPRGRQ